MLRRSQAGGLKVSTVIVLMIMLSGAFLAFKALPPMITNFEFQDDMDRQARFSVYSSADADSVRAKVLARARVLGLPVTPNQVDVHKSYDQVTIHVKYDVPVRVPFHPFTLHFDDDSQETRL
jgi:hypothetical protein